MSRRSVVVVGHDASRTGAPVALASVLRWVRRHDAGEPTLVLLAGGPLLPAYRSLARTLLLPTRRAAAVRSLVAGGRSVGVSMPTRWGQPSVGAVPEADVVLANTLASLPVAARLADRGRSSRTRLVCHVHELDGVAERLLPGEELDRRLLLERVDRWIAAGPAVTDMLVRRLGVAATAVSTVDGFVEPPAVGAIDRAAARTQLRLDRDGPVVLGVGALNRRKGPERFVDLLSALAEHPSAPLGRWLGGLHTGAVHQEVVADVARSPRPGSIELVESVADPTGCLAVSDVVVSTSIEDPYPLSALEAGALGVPVVGYDAGGLGPFLTGAGQPDAAIRLGDLGALASLVGELLDDETARVARGRALADHVRSTHLVEHQVPALWSAVTE